MTDITNPTTNPEKAAMQLIVELIRAERVPVYSTNVNGLLTMYDQMVEHFKGDDADDDHDIDF